MWKRKDDAVQLIIGGPDVLERACLAGFPLGCVSPIVPDFGRRNLAYQWGSIMLTSNRSLKEWPDLFGAPLLASAGLDRLTLRAHVVVITGASFRAHGPHRTEKEVPVDSTDHSQQICFVYFSTRNFPGATHVSGLSLPKITGPISGED